MPEFLMPRLGADMTAGKVVTWLKQPGERIERGDIIAIVETDKANVDVESFIAGVLEKILVQPGGDPLPVGTPLALIRSEAGAEPAAVTVAPAVAAALRTGRRLALTAPAAHPAVAPATYIAARCRRRRARVSPAARKRALELRLDPAALTGTGPEGRVTLADVERAAQGVERPAQGAAAQAAPADTSAARQLRMREAIASAMARSKREIPHYYLACTIDLGQALAWLTERNAGRAVTERLIYAVLLIKAAALALREVPELNGILDRQPRAAKRGHPCRNRDFAARRRAGRAGAAPRRPAVAGRSDARLSGPGQARPRRIAEEFRSHRPDRDHHQPG